MDRVSDEIREKIARKAGVEGLKKIAKDTGLPSQRVLRVMHDLEPFPRSDYRKQFTPSHISYLEDCVANGISYSDAAKELGVPIHRVKAQYDKFESQSIAQAEGNGQNDLAIPKNPRAANYENGHDKESPQLRPLVEEDAQVLNHRVSESSRLAHIVTSFGRLSASHDHFKRLYAQCEKGDWHVILREFARSHLTESALNKLCISVSTQANKVLADVREYKGAYGESCSPLLKELYDKLKGSVDPIGNSAKDFLMGAPLDLEAVK